MVLLHGQVQASPLRCSPASATGNGQNNGQWATKQQQWREEEKDRARARTGIHTAHRRYPNQGVVSLMLGADAGGSARAGCGELSAGPDGPTRESVPPKTTLAEADECSMTAAESEPSWRGGQRERECVSAGAGAGETETQTERPRSQSDARRAGRKPRSRAEKSSTGSVTDRWCSWRAGRPVSLTHARTPALTHAPPPQWRETRGRGEGGKFGSVEISVVRCPRRFHALSRSLLCFSSF